VRAGVRVMTRKVRNRERGVVSAGGRWKEIQTERGMGRGRARARERERERERERLHEARQDAREIKQM
jgi:hypothetical protein